jgi:hypothetical protein
MEFNLQTDAVFGASTILFQISIMTISICMLADNI